MHRAGEDRDLPEQAYAAALASVPGIGPRRLRAMLAKLPPHAAWARLMRQPTEGDGEVLRTAAWGIDVAQVWSAHSGRGIGIAVLGSGDYPARLASDPEAPAVLFWLGDVGVLDDRPRVAIVGTRSATRYGLGIAAQLGAELSGAGVSVVSGLALGIDAAAHEGASGACAVAPAGPPVAVVAGGLDATYPRRNARLSERVAGCGVVVSEAAVGGDTAKWRFPQRNRIIAALCDVVVVVECHATGGALHTVRAAERRGVTVGAVPGSVRSPASVGTNNLLADGCIVVRDATDVLVALELARVGDAFVRPHRHVDAPMIRARPGDLQATLQEPANQVPGSARTDEQLLAAMGHDPCSIDDLIGATGFSLVEIAAALERLGADGRVECDAGWWSVR